MRRSLGRRRAGSAAAPRAAGRSANRGSDRRWSTPALHRTSCRSPGSRWRVDQRRQRRGPGDQPSPARQPAQRVVRARPQPAGVGVVQHLRLVRRHVDPGRAVPRTALAGQAEIERRVHLRRPPAGWTSVAVDHLLQHPGPAAGGVLLLPGGLVRRAHHAETAGAVGQALAHARAAVHLGGEVRSAVRADQRPTARRSASTGRGSTSTPGLSRFVRVEDRLHLPEQAAAPRGSTSSAAAPSAPGRRRARPTSIRRSPATRSAAVLDEARGRRPRRRGRSAGSRSGRARSRRRSARTAVRAVRARSAARRSRAGRRPASAGGTAASSHPGYAGSARLTPGQPGAVLADLPQRERPDRVRRRRTPSSAPAAASSAVGAGPELAGVVADQLDEHPAVAAGERRHRAVARGCGGPRRRCAGPAPRTRSGGTRRSRGRRHRRRPSSGSRARS